MNNYAHFAFDDLMKEPENQCCFDCNKQPTQWASVNNAVYLCIQCSGNHRGYGANVSYVRSLTLDNWNDHQIALMKCGGNRNLRELLDIYEIDKNKVDKKVLYSSRLMEFYRRYLKSKINNENVDQPAPSKEDALKSVVPLNNSNVTNNNKFQSISSCGSEPISSDDKSMMSLLNNWMTKAYDSTKTLATKVGELEIQKKIVGAGNAILDKSTEISVRILYNIIEK